MGTPSIPLRGMATIHLESPHEEGQEHGVLDMTADVRLILTPIMDEVGTTIVRYDISLGGSSADVRIGMTGS